MKGWYGFLTSLVILVLGGGAGLEPAATALPVLAGETMAPVASSHSSGSPDWAAERVDTHRLMVRGDRGMAADAAGGGPVFWGGDSLSDAWCHGGAWQIETVDTAGDGGQYASLVLDAAGRPRIAYIGGGVRYATHDGTGWSIETVDPAGAAGTSLQLDAADRPHISYVGAGLHYASHDGAAWSITLVDAAAVSSYTSLDLDSLGRPHIAYLAAHEVAHELRYAYYDGSGWLTETVSVWAGEVGYPSLALDSADRPRLGFTHTDCYHYCFPTLVYAWKDGFSWNEQPLDILGGWYADLALDAADRPHLTFRSGGGYPPFGHPMYARQEGGDWVSLVVDDSSWTGEGYTALVLDDAGRPHVAYCAGHTEYNCSSLRYASLDGAAWVTETVDARALAYPSLALDAQGYAHIAYYDSASGDLLYARQACVPIEELRVTGPISQPLGITALYTATFAPLTATAPTFTWDNGAVGPVAPYTWTVTGPHTLSVTGTNACSERTAGLTVTVFCQPLTGVAVRGPHSLLVDQRGIFAAVAQPITSSPPLTFTWDNGAAGPQAAYSWALTGTYTLTVSATNVCGGGGTGRYTVRVLAEWPYTIYLPLALSGF